MTTKTSPDATVATVSALAGEAIGLLTRAARLTRSQGDGLEVPIDFADFLAQVLASVSANLGGIDELLAGRPGSWEAGYVYNLVFGTVGPDPIELLRYRTEPTVVPLNVADLVWEAVSAGVAAEGIEPYDTVVARVSEPGVDAPSSVWDVWNAEIDAIHDRYVRAYAGYGEAFREAVLAQVAGMPALHGADGQPETPVAVVVEPDPEVVGGVENPPEDGDPLVWRLWEHAYRAVPLPAVESAR